MSNSDNNQQYLDFLNKEDDDFFFSLVTDEVKPNASETKPLAPLFVFNEPKKNDDHMRFLFCDEKMEPVLGNKRKIENVQSNAPLLTSRLQFIKILQEILETS